jgi:hypothetical protein
MFVQSAPLTSLSSTSLPALADGEYDVVILGTGLKECDSFSSHRRPLPHILTLSSLNA